MNREWRVGDVFRWPRDGAMCRIVEIRDYGFQLDFVYAAGPRKGQFGYTILPQDIEPVSAIELLAALAG